MLHFLFGKKWNKGWNKNKMVKKNGDLDDSDKRGKAGLKEDTEH